MKLIDTIKKLLRSSVRELSDAVAGEQLVKPDDLTATIEQAQLELDQVSSLHRQLRAQLLDSETEQQQLAEKNESLQQQIVQLLGSNDENRALELAEVMSANQNRQSVVQESLQQQRANLSRVEQHKAAAQRKLLQLLRDAELVQTTQTIQDTTAQLREQLDQGVEHLTSGRQTLEKIKQQQQHNDDYQQALDDLQGGSDLQQKFIDAGLDNDPNSAANILRKLKEQTHGKS